jgi:hypothetical protein
MASYVTRLLPENVGGLGARARAVGQDSEPLSPRPEISPADHLAFPELI